MSKKELIGESDQGSYGSPGSQFVERLAKVYRTRRGYELQLEHSWGSNQGYLQRNGDDSRRFRADSLDELLRIGIAESRGDETFGDPKFAQAIRDAIYEAEDAQDDAAE